MSNYRSSFLSSIPTVTKNLLAINFILWLASVVAPGFFMHWGLHVDLQDILGMHYWSSSKFNITQLITYAFMHGSFEHVFFNMFGVFLFGSALENYWGPRKFLFYYIVTGIGAGIVQQLFWTIEVHPFIVSINNAMATYPAQAADLAIHKMNELNMLVTIGASGSVFGLLIAFGWLFPEARLMLLFLPIPIKARIFVALYAIVELTMGVANFKGDNIAHFAHLGGMLFGIIILLIWRKKR